jgi:glycosyl transferase, family 25
MDNVIALAINLDRSKDRLEHIRKQLENKPFTWQRVPAVDGWSNEVNLEASIDRNAFEKQHGKPALPGEIGCYLSHIKAIQLFVDSTYDYGLILEDDVQLGENLCPTLFELIQNNDKWDLIKLSGIHNGNPLSICKLASGLNISIATTNYTGASCYMINKEAGRKMLKHLLPMKLPYDLAYDQGWHLKYKVRIVNPAPCLHSFAMGSELHPKNIIRENFHWTKRIHTYTYRLQLHTKRFIYGIKEFLTYKIN